MRVERAPTHLIAAVCAICKIAPRAAKKRGVKLRADVRNDALRTAAVDQRARRRHAMCKRVDLH